jgi:proline iminopeptidase
MTARKLSPDQGGRFVELPDAQIHVVERGHGLPLIVLHGGPGLDHHEFGDYLDPLADRWRLIFVDQRGQGLSTGEPRTWSLARMASDVGLLAGAMGLTRYGVLGHSYGAFVALQAAVDHPGHAAAVIVSSGLPSQRHLEAVERNLAAFEPIELREQVAASWARERNVRTSAGVERLLHDQMPFHFADPRDPRIAEMERRTAGGRYSAAVLRHFSRRGYGGLDLDDRLAAAAAPMLVLAGRHDRVCTVTGGEAIARGVLGAEFVVFERSAHMTYVEEPERYLAVVGDFLVRQLG